VSHYVKCVERAIGVRMEFKSFEKITKFSGIAMTITQKIHGSNAQIRIYEADGVIKCQASSRTRDIFVGDDNFGFARYVKDNEAEIIEKLGLGTHFGEWAGPGINSGEGLKEKTFVIFNHRRFPPERPLPPQMVVVPVIYHGPYDETHIKDVMNFLKTEGSVLSPGFMRPEGVVIEIGDKRYKKVFEAEETKWTEGSAGPKPPPIEGYDASHLLQPIRLEKLLSKDEKYLREYPESLRVIVADYTQDLIDEGQIVGTELEIRSIKKAAGGQLFAFIRQSVDKLLPPV
jgi:hypothetical protein